MKKILTVILTTLLLQTPAQAIPVRDAVQTALTNNPDLRRTEQSIRVAEESLKSARGQKGVTISASGSLNASKTEGLIAFHLLMDLAALTGFSGQGCANNELYQLFVNNAIFRRTFNKRSERRGAGASNRARRTAPSNQS